MREEIVMFAMLLVATLAVPMLDVDADASSCRMSPSLELNQCSLPYNLGNFQGYHECDPSVLIGRPENLEEVQAMVVAFERVKAVGVGHSWWQEQFCSGGSEDESINIVMTELNNTLDFIKNPVDPKEFGGKAPPSGFPIQVDEDNQTVTVAAGIPQRALLEYLSEYKYGQQPQGWTLPAFSYFIDQTIGGAIATGTHGSSLQHGSLSSQLVSLRLMLANGTVLDLSPESDPHLFKAAGVSIGRLGVITDLTISIVPDETIVRSLEDTNLLGLAKTVKKVQDEYNAAMEVGNSADAMMALSALDKTQSFWHPINDVVWKVDFVSSQSMNQTMNKSSADSRNLSDIFERFQNVSPSNPEDFSLDVFEQVVNPHKVQPKIAITKNPQIWGRLYTANMRAMVVPSVTEASKSYVTMSERMNEQQATNDPYDQFEAAIPIAIAGDCLLGLNKIVYGQNLSLGFRTPALIRFVSEEDFYLSPSNGHPVMYINIEDHLSISSGVQNKEFDQVLDYFLDECDARLHWGKAGWPTHQPCFDGAEDYPDTWCDFGCAVHDLDPLGKFRSESDVWRWSASRDGSPVEFSTCCSADGFMKSQCVCERTPIC